MKNILVISPHPDDETLGCGGTLLRYQDEGYHLFWLIMTTISEDAGYNKKIVASRKEEIKIVAKKYGFNNTIQTDFITTELDIIPIKKMVSVISRAVDSIQPDTIYIPYRNDIHSDHKVVFDAAAACTKSFRYPWLKRVRVYETLSETEFSLRPECSSFKPNLWVDISSYIDKKIEIMNIYKGESDVHPFPRSEQNMRALATLRGATVGCIAAEAFMSLKEII